MKFKAAFFIPVLIFAIIGIVPYHAAQFGGMLDGSWARVMHLGFINHWQWGRDIVFTMGPYGFLISDQDTRTHWLSFGIWLAMAGIFALALHNVANSYSKNKWLALAWSLFFVVISTASLLGSTDALCVGFVLLLILSRNALDKRLLIAALALISLMKDSALVDGVVVITLLDAEQISECRIKNLSDSMIWQYSLWIFAFWLIAFQNPLHLIPWVLSSIHTIGAYGDAMSSTGNAECSDLVIWFVASALMGLMLWGKRRGVLQFSAFAFVIFTAYKHAFIRHDGHEMQAWAIMVLVSMCGIALCWEDAP